MDIKAMARQFAARENRRHLVVMALLLVACVAAFTLLGAFTLPGSDNIYRYEQVMENATGKTDPLLEGGELVQMLRVEGPLYGVALRVDTGGRQLQGTLALTLEPFYREGRQLKSELSLSELRDGEYQDFVFDSLLHEPEAEWYALRITAKPATPQDAPRFYKSEGFPDFYYDTNLNTSHYRFLDEFLLTEHGEPRNEMLDVQYLVDVTGSFLVGPYCFFAALLTVAVVALYALLFVLRRPPHQVFVVAALALGLVFMVLIPPRATPDEYAHIATAYHYSNVVLGTADGDVLGGSVWVRAGDEMKLWNYDTTSVGAFAWKDMAQNLAAPAGEGGGQVQARSLGVFPMQMAVPALGVILARLLGLGRVGLLLLGRLFNLVFYTAVVSRAIKRMPLAKPMLFCVALLPMSLQLAASFSYDTYVTALGFYLLAACLDYRCNKKHVGAPQIALLAVVCLLLAPAKSAYVFMLALLFLVKPRQFSSKRVCWMARGGILGAGLCLWLVFTSTSLLLSLTGSAQTAGVLTAGVAAPGQVQVQPTVAQHPPAPLMTAIPADDRDTNLVDGYQGELKENGDAVQLYSAGYILRHIPGTVKLLLRTVWEQGPLWVQGLVGGRLGESIAVDIEVSWALVAGLLGVLGLATLCAPNDARTLLPKHRLGLFAIAAACAGAMVLASLTWTPANYLTIFGIQGRYLLPVLPLVMLALRGRRLRFTKPCWRQLAFAQVVLVAACQAQAFLAVLHLPATGMVV